MKLFPERIKLALGKRMTDFSLKFSLTKLKKKLCHHSDFYSIFKHTLNNISNMLLVLLM